jgi:hypothetical protein
VPVWFVYLLISLTTFSVTRLVIKDTFPPLGVPRNHLINWWDPDEDWIVERASDPAKPIPVAHWGAVGRSLRYLFTCPWCMSVWVGAIVTWIFTLYVSVPLPVVAVIVARAVTGLIARNLDPDD